MHQVGILVFFLAQDSRGPAWSFEVWCSQRMLVTSPRKDGSVNLLIGIGTNCPAKMTFLHTWAQYYSIVNGL